MWKTSQVGERVVYRLFKLGRTQHTAIPCFSAHTVGASWKQFWCYAFWHRMAECFYV